MNSFNALSNSSLSLSANRLSGNLPSSFKKLRTISVLDSNLFPCSYDRSELPTADPSYKTYQCASSNSFIIILLLWVIAIVFVVVVKYDYLRESIREYSAIKHRVVLGLQSFVSIVIGQKPLHQASNLAFSGQSVILREIFTAASAVMIIISLLLYGSLSISSSSYSHRYSFTTTAAYLTGLFEKA